MAYTPKSTNSYGSSSSGSTWMSYGMSQDNDKPEVKKKGDDDRWEGRDNKDHKDGDQWGDNNDPKDHKDDGDKDYVKKIGSESESEAKADADAKAEAKVDVDVDVNVKVDLDLDSLPEDNDVMDLDIKFEDELEGAFVAVANNVDQHTNGGDAFNIQQVNSIVDNDELHNPNVSFNAGGGAHPAGLIDLPIGDSGSEFKQIAHAEGGETHTGNVDTTENGIGDIRDGSSSPSSDAIVDQEAFTQNIVQGANIQFNSSNIEMGDGDLIG